MLDDLRSLLEDQLKDLYSAEKQLIKALPRMAKKASNDDLRAGFEEHLNQTVEHAARLEEIAQVLEMKPTGKVCKAMQGLIEEGKEVLEEDGDDAVIDAALIAAAQRVEHYEISGYGSARAVAEKLGLGKVAKILQKTLDEERETDEKLTQLSESEVLNAALNGAEASEDAEEEVKKATGSRRRAR